MTTIHKNLIASGHALANEMTGTPAALVKELTDQLEVQRVRADVLMKERDEACTALSSAMLTISQITDIVGTSDTLSISQQVAALAKSAAEHQAQGVDGLLSAFESHVSNAGLSDADTVSILECKDALKHCAELRKGAGNEQ